MDKNQTKFILDEKDMATAWYNVVADLPEPLPPILHPGTRNRHNYPLPCFVMRSISRSSVKSAGSISRKKCNPSIACGDQPPYSVRINWKRRWIPGKIYYKFEDSSPAGSHKPNTAVRRLTI